MSERLLETFREKAEQATRVPAFELIEAAGRARRRRRHVAGGAMAALVLATTGILLVTNEPSAPPQPAEKTDDTSLVTPYPGNQGRALDEGTYEFELTDPALPNVRFTLPRAGTPGSAPTCSRGIATRRRVQGTRSGTSACSSSTSSRSLSGGAA